MANLGSGNISLVIDGSTSSFTDFGGTDTYTISPVLSGDVTIQDNDTSTIILPPGLTITAANFLSDGVQFTVNGNTFTLLGSPSQSSFVFGGSNIDPMAGTPLDFDATAAAFGTTIPAIDEAPNAATVTGVVKADGTLNTDQTSPPKFGWINATTYVSGKAGGYNVRFEASNVPDQELLQSIANAAERVSDIILKPLPEHLGTQGISVNIQFTDLDGYWGTASAQGLRPDSLLPARGIMKLDPTEAQNAPINQFEDLVFHEFLHCLGFGGRWDDMGLVQDSRFTGPAAIAAYQTEFPSIAANDPHSHFGVPLEDTGPDATVGKHWDDRTFGDEVMTSWLNGTNHVSKMTIAALYDMGYEVII